MRAVGAFVRVICLFCDDQLIKFPECVWYAKNNNSL